VSRAPRGCGVAQVPVAIDWSPPVLPDVIVIPMVGILIAAAVVLWASVESHAADDVALATPEPSALLEQLLLRADREALYDDPTWLALLHYETHWLPPLLRSTALTPSFFLSAEGNHDPRAELHATLRAFLAPGAVVRDGEHPQCAFVARRHWLSQRLGLGASDLPRVECPDYERWRAGLDARGLTLIFPEGFMNSPASMFGHTLLRIDASTEEGPEALLGSAVDFTAVTGPEQGPQYIAKGLFGLYPGEFGVRPYYEQLKRYSDWENRDIWEYRLHIDPGALDLILMHLWELRGIDFPYYFLTRNCSYELLRLLEVGVPELQASTRFRGPVIPVDTVKAIVAKPGIVEGVRYRASPETQLRTTLSILSPADRQRVQDIVQGRLDPEDEAVQGLPPAQRARVLDAAYDQLRYEYLSGQVTDEESRALSRRILVSRSRSGQVAQEGPIAEVAVPEVRPDQGHDSMRVSLAAGWRDHEAFIDLGLRPAFHGLLDNGGGYSEHMEVRLLDTRVRIFPETGQVRLQELTLLGAVSLSPRNRVFKPWAWSFSTGEETRRVPGNGPSGLKDIAVWGSEGGVGLAWEPAPGGLVYGLTDARLDVGPELVDDVSFGPGARLGILLGRRDSRWGGHVFGEFARFVAGDTTTWARGGAEVRMSVSRNTAVVLQGSVNQIYGDSWLEGSVRFDLFL
jgi:hypothetical protein